MTESLQIYDIALSYSDDKCVERLAAIIEHKDSKDLRELSTLISRLAVPIE